MENSKFGVNSLCNLWVNSILCGEDGWHTAHAAVSLLTVKSTNIFDTGYTEKKSIVPNIFSTTIIAGKQF